MKIKNSAKFEKQKKVEKLKTVRKAKKRENDEAEWEQLQTEERLAKKLKRGQITQQKYNELMGEDDMDLLSD